MDIKLPVPFRRGGIVNEENDCGQIFRFGIRDSKERKEKGVDTVFSGFPKKKIVLCKSRLIRYA